MVDFNVEGNTDVDRLPAPQQARTHVTDGSKAKQSAIMERYTNQCTNVDIQNKKNITGTGKNLTTGNPPTNIEQLCNPKSSSQSDTNTLRRDNRH
ncbi:hypothetical protein A3Q56_05117 [Intoshia linei]|uniref:Uncharacterized protein n=1 Tax=Intoshia linei TaxID=1819745 RepID=A0A177AYW0_9BILA|nr:hypothetical protein A3Q56_05117 [Intoshia linei]